MISNKHPKVHYSHKWSLLYPWQLQHFHSSSIRTTEERRNPWTIHYPSVRNLILLFYKLLHLYFTIFRLWKLWYYMFFIFSLFHNFASGEFPSSRITKLKIGKWCLWRFWIFLGPLSSFSFFGGNWPEQKRNNQRVLKNIQEYK